MAAAYRIYLAKRRKRNGGFKENRIGALTKTKNGVKHVSFKARKKEVLHSNTPLFFIRLCREDGSLRKIISGFYLFRYRLQEPLPHQHLPY
jgi:hypothetical protein